MIEPTGHCPYLGLKQNRAIRFASPTPEHRCYVSGEPLDIPVDQAKYCLSQGHVHCPLYMGLSLPTTNDPAPAEASPAPAPAGGLRGWYASLSPRDRAIYAAMLGMLALIIAIYLFAGLRAFFSGASVGERPTNLAVATSTQIAVAVATAAPTAPLLPTPSELPTSSPAPEPTDIPPTDVLIPRPTSAPTNPPAPTRAPVGQPATAGAPSAATAPLAAATAAGSSVGGATSSGSGALPAAATAAPPSSRPTSAPAAAPSPSAAASRPTNPPQASANLQPVTLYFADTSGTLYVPVRRAVAVENQQVAAAAVRGLIEGPRSTSLTSLVPSDARLLGVTIAADATAFVNFDRQPGDDDFALDSIVLTLTETEFRGVIQRVQLQVNGQNVGGIRARPVVNPINPDGLQRDVAVTEFLPLYFLSKDGLHHVRVIRMVEKTKQTADATLRALLQGPIGYEYALRRSIPDGTELLRVSKDGSTLWVDFSEPFVDAPDRTTAVRTVVESLTTLPGVSGVRFLVEGTSLADQWGAEYGRIFTRPPINPE